MPGELSALRNLLNVYMEKGEVTGSLVPKLEDSLKQAQHHIDKDSYHKGASFLEKFINQLDHKNKKDHVTEEAKYTLSVKAEKLISNVK